jgi:hypothetical protein
VMERQVGTIFRHHEAIVRTEETRVRLIVWDRGTSHSRQGFFYEMPDMMNLADTTGRHPLIATKATWGLLYVAAAPAEPLLHLKHTGRVT